MSKSNAEIVKDIIEIVGGKENIISATHCATRLRVVLNDFEKVDKSKIEKVDKVKGAFINSGQLQIIFGVGLVDEICSEFLKETGASETTVENIKKDLTKKQNPFQRALKAISDSFLPLIPALLAAALLMGLNNLLSQPGIFMDEMSVIDKFPSIEGFAGMVNLMANSVFTFLPLLICYTATKRFGGTPLFGLILGSMMLHPDLSNAYQVGSGDVTPDVWNLFGLTINQVGFQGGVVPAILGGLFIAKAESFFKKIVPESIRLFLVPFSTLIVSGFAMFLFLGPLGREIGFIITDSLMWFNQTLGVLGAFLFSGLQQAIVVTGVHHTLQTAEITLLASEGTNYLNPLMNAAVCAQAGAVLGMLVLKRKDKDFRQIGVSSFFSAILAITEPALFGVNLKYKFPFFLALLAGGIGGIFMNLNQVIAISMGSVGIPGIALVAPGMWLQYIIGGLLSLLLAAVFVVVYAKIKKPNINY